MKIKSVESPSSPGSLTTTYPKAFFFFFFFFFLQIHIIPLCESKFYYLLCVYQYMLFISSTFAVLGWLYYFNVQLSWLIVFMLWNTIKVIKTAVSYLTTPLLCRLEPKRLTSTKCASARALNTGGGGGGWGGMGIAVEWFYDQSPRKNVRWKGDSNRWPSDYQTNAHPIELPGPATQLSRKFILLIYFKMPTDLSMNNVRIFNTLILTNRTNFMLSWADHETCFTNPGPGLQHFLYKYFYS